MVNRNHSCVRVKGPPMAMTICLSCGQLDRSGAVCVRCKVRFDDGSGYHQGATLVVPARRRPSVSSPAQCVATLTEPHTSVLDAVLVLTTNRRG